MIIEVIKSYSNKIFVCRRSIFLQYFKQLIPVLLSQLKIYFNFSEIFNHAENVHARESLLKQEGNFSFDLREKKFQQIKFCQFQQFQSGKTKFEISSTSAIFEAVSRAGKKNVLFFVHFCSFLSFVSTKILHLDWV